MSAQRILTISFLISLVGHLVVFTTFSVGTFEEGERPYEIARVYFLGEFVEEKPFPRVEAMAREGSMPQLRPMVREPEVGPSLSLSKPRPTVPAPQISVEGIIYLLRDKETSLLEDKVRGEMKENPPERPHLLEKEQEE